ncbi:MAG: aminotransferase class V-fold PLP-dependent enzyme [Clostridia bacterium]|nr:aminotransferase class V-fold PLP-dependent enzyme [Clostridia bacterium]
MKTPLNDFLEEYVKENKTRFHMPGHKGRAFIGVEKYDITEVEGADVLYAAEGVLKESMENASTLFGTGKTLYSTEGSSLSIRAMVYLLKLYALSQGRNPKIAAFRNAHKTFITACALTGTEIEWLYGKENKGITCCNISADEVRSYLDRTEELPAAVYVTSPDYLGNMADIKALSALCREKGIILAVDNAHGAYLSFLPENLHPIHLGADICCDSAHKTLPVLTGGAYLHISKTAPDLFSEKAEYALSLFASTSPSYLILCSLDKINSLLADDYAEKLASFTEKVQSLRNKLVRMGYAFIGDEPLKLTFDSKKYGYKGTELAQYLLHNSIVCEFSDRDYTVLMLTDSNSEQDFDRLLKALGALPKKEMLTEAPPEITAPERVLPLSDCIYLPTERISTEKALGRVCGSINISCPPAVPVVIAGERIGKEQTDLLKYYGIEEVEVVHPFVTP